MGFAIRAADEAAGIFVLRESNEVSRARDGFRVGRSRRYFDSDLRTCCGRNQLLTVAHLPTFAPFGNREIAVQWYQLMQPNRDGRADRSGNQPRGISPIP